MFLFNFIVIFNEARETKTYVGEVLLQLFLFCSNKMLFPLQTRNLINFLHLMHVTVLYYIVYKYHKLLLKYTTSI